jgi:predicted metal-binding membrane protein
MPMPGGQTAAAYMGVWVVMMVAMMSPSLVPALTRYRRSVPAPGVARPSGLTALVVAGYFFVWTLVGGAAYLMGVAVTDVEQQWPGLERFVPVAAGAVLLLAGCVQLTAWKRRHLARCRDCEPPPASDAWSAARHGVRLGINCALCCAGFMTVLLVTGMMNLVTIFLVAAAITVERLAPAPARTSRALGAAILAVAAVAIVRGAGAL